ncbi:hypothetical protein ACLB2K_056154 [Fragaria x ananassa]
MSIRNKFLSLLYILPQRKRVKQGHANGSNVVARDVYLGTGIATGSNVDPYLPIWKALWKAKVPNKEYLKAQSVSSGTTTPTRQKLRKQWQPHLGSTVKLNVDDSFLPDVTQGGFGSVLQDSQSQFLVGFAHRMEHVSSSLHSELEAIRYGVDFLQAMHIGDAVVESDCLVSVTTLNSPEDDLSLLSALILEIKETLAANRGFSL